MTSAILLQLQMYILNIENVCIAIEPNINNTGIKTTNMPGPGWASD